MSSPDSLSEAPSLDTVREIIREAEAYLNAQLTAGIAADQRAIALASVLAAATVVIVGGGVGLLLTMKDPFLAWVGLVVGVFLIVAMALAMISAMPATFEFPGNSPAHWHDDVETKRPMTDALAEQADHYASMIAENGRLLRRNAHQLRAAMWVAWGGLVIGALLVGMRFAFVTFC